MDDEIGYVTKIERVQDNEGRLVLRATVDFWDGSCPPLTFGTVFNRVPVKIVEQRADSSSAQQEKP